MVTEPGDLTVSSGADRRVSACPVRPGPADLIVDDLPAIRRQVP